MNRLKELREASGYNMKEVATALKIPYTTYVNYEKGAREPNSEMLILLAKFYNTTIDYIVGKNDAKSTIPPGFEPLPKMVLRPIVGDIACGDPITAEQNIQDYAEVPEQFHCDFCLRCHGDSMVDAGIQDGDIVYIHIQPQVENGQIAAVRIDGEATLKRVFWDEQQQVLQLAPCNPAIAPLIYTGPILDTVQIEGLAVGYTHWF